MAEREKRSCSAFLCNRKLRSYYTKTCPKITYSLIQLHGVEFFCQQIQKALAEIT